MTPKITKLFDDLEADLRLTDLQAFANRVAHIKKSLTPVKKKAPVKGTALKLEITENGKTNEIVFQTEKEAEKYLVLKQKERLKTAKRPEGLSVPKFDYYRGTYAQKVSDYNRDCVEYWKAAQEQNLDFRVIISRA